MTHRLRSLFISIITILLILSFSAPAFAVSEPELSASGAILYCDTTDKVLYKKNADFAYDPYSITKLVTAYLVSQNIEDFNTVVTVSYEAAMQPGSSMGLYAGEVLTVEQLMFGMLLWSGNDAAYALGEAVAGDNESFVAMMNELAEEQGCKSTHFENSYGWQSPDHYTSAADYLVLTRLALSDKRVFSIASSKTYYMPETNMSEEREMKTHVPLLTVKDSGIVAGKTGYWEAYDCSAAIRYNKDGLELTLVLLADNEDDRKDDMLKLISYGVDTVVGFEGVTKGDSCGKVFVKHGKRTRAAAEIGGTVMAYPASEDEKDITTKTVLNKDIEAPLKAGDEIGTIEVYANGKLAGTAPILISEDVETGWLLSYLYISNKATLILILPTLLAILYVAAKIDMKRRTKKRQLARAARNKTG